jgi:hypothetical protein
VVDVNTDETTVLLFNKSVTLVFPVAEEIIVEMILRLVVELVFGVVKV